MIVAWPENEFTETEDRAAIANLAINNNIYLDKKKFHWKEKTINKNKAKIIITFYDKMVSSDKFQILIKYYYITCFLYFVTGFLYFVTNLLVDYNYEDDIILSVSNIAFSVLISIIYAILWPLYLVISSILFPWLYLNNLILNEDLLFMGFLSFPLLIISIFIFIDKKKLHWIDKQNLILSVIIRD